MDEQAAVEDGASGGISRRDLITRSVVAGGLVWAAPVLLSGQAAADEPCCADGTPVTIKVAETGGVNCGVACISSRGMFNYDCPPDLVDCLNQLELVVGHFQEGGDDTARITLSPGIALISAAVKAGPSCYFSDCPCFASSQTDATCPNTCERENGSACRFTGNNPPLPPAPGGVNRIWVTPNGDGSTDVNVNTHPDGVLNHVELSICLAPEITGICP